MKIFGKTLSEYINFEKWFLILVLVVGLLRLELSILGVSPSVDKFLSLTVLLLLGLLYYSIKFTRAALAAICNCFPCLPFNGLLVRPS